MLHRCTESMMSSSICGEELSVTWLLTLTESADWSEREYLSSALQISNKFIGSIS